MRPRVLTIPETTFGEFASQVKRSTGSRAFRCVGDPNTKVSRVLLGPAAATPKITADADVFIGGSQPEADGNFDNLEYTVDATALGMPKCFIILGHVMSEQLGMEDLGKWISTFIRDVVRLRNSKSASRQGLELSFRELCGEVFGRFVQLGRAGEPTFQSR